MKKKNILFLMIILLLFFLTSCGGSKVEANDGKIVFSFPEEYLQYVPYDEVPNYTLTFDGIINTVSNTSLSNNRYFSKNDDFILSEIIKDLIDEYRQKARLSITLIKQDEKYETKMNKLVADKKGELVHDSQVMKVKDGEIFNEIAIINLENGLTLTIEYRRFISDFEGDEKTYYAWRYVSPLNMVLHYPVMLHLNESGEKEFLIFPTPPKVIYHLSVSRQLPLDRLLLKDEYFKEQYRRFKYSDYNTDPRNEEANESFNLEASIKQVKDYYIRDFDAEEVDGIFKFYYLGYSFKVTFEDISFVIDAVN